MSRKRKLLELLYERSHSQQELAQRLNCTTRHVRRLTEQLEAQGLIRKERRGRRIYYTLSLLMGETIPIRLELTEREVLALSVAGVAATSLLEGLPLGENLRDLFRRLEAQLNHIEYFAVHPEHIKPRFYFKAIAHTRIDPNVFEVVLEALLTNCTLEIDYDHPRNGLDKNRRINPLCLAIVGNAVQLTAWCHRRRRLTNFAMARIRSARVLEHETFTPPDAFDPATYYTTDTMGAVADDSYYVYRLKIGAQVAHCFREREYFPSQVIEKEAPDGSLVVSYEGPGLSVMRAFVMSWGKDVQVLEPPELVACIREELEALRTYYGMNEASGRSKDAQ